MTMTFFSVDVETTSTNPFTGQLLTVGIVAVDGDTLEVDEGIHVPLVYKNTPEFIDIDTLAWWRAQDPIVYEETWYGSDHRLHSKEATEVIDNYLNQFTTDKKERIFCANPVSFDYPWVLKLYARANQPMPFNHRTVCMRSMYYGIVGGTWGESRSAGNWHYPERPHHALSDAQAQALDFVKMFMMTHEENRVESGLTTVGDVYD